MKKLSIAVLTVMCLVLVAGTALAAREVTVTSVTTVTIDAAGLYAITLPMDTACACAEFGHWYGISFEFLTAFASRPDLITDDIPVGCVSWNDYGAGWEDLQSYGFPGEVSLIADIVCCSNPVPAEKNTWGEIKAMFR
jgi:hypothetical protein